MAVVTQTDPPKQIECGSLNVVQCLTRSPKWRKQASAYVVKWGTMYDGSSHLHQDIACSRRERKGRKLNNADTDMAYSYGEAEPHTADKKGLGESDSVNTTDKKGWLEGLCSRVGRGNHCNYRHCPWNV